MLTFRRLPGFPDEGIETVPIGAGGLKGGWSGHSEGMIVEFESTKLGVKWIGNFQPGSGSWNGIVGHPNKKNILVVANGQGYLVDPLSREVADRPNDIQCVLELPGLLVISDGITLTALGESGAQWQSERIAWDEMRNLRVVDGILLGEASGPGDKTWLEFSLDLASGEVTHSHYEKTMKTAKKITEN